MFSRKEYMVFTLSTLYTAQQHFGAVWIWRYDLGMVDYHCCRLRLVLFWL